MKKVIFFNVPAHGHVNPSLGLVQELTSQGQEVHYYCSEEFQQKIEAAGAVFHPLPFTIAPEYSKDFHLIQVIGDILQKGREMLPEMIEEVKKGDYDYIISDFFAFWGPIISMETGLKTILLRPVFAMHKKIQHPKGFKSGLWKTPFKTIRQIIRTLQHFRYLKKRYKLPTLGIKSMFEDWLPASMVLVCTSKMFQPKAGLFDDKRYKFIGSVTEARAEQQSDFPMHRIDDNRPLIVVSLGSIINNNLPFFSACVEAFRDSPYQVVLSIGNQLDAVDLKLPEHIIAWPFIPQLALLKKAAVFITHGGMNSAVEGIMNEVPMIVIPQVSDQFLVAQELERCGVAYWARKKPNAARLKAWTENVFENKEICKNIATLKQSFIESGGAKRAVAEIFDFVNY